MLTFSTATGLVNQQESRTRVVSLCWPAAQCTERGASVSQHGLTVVVEVVEEVVVEGVGIRRVRNRGVGREAGNTEG